MTYRWLSAGLLNPVMFDELPLRAVKMSLGVNAPGAFSAALPLVKDVGQPRPADLVNATHPAQRVIYGERDGVIVGAWIIWGRRYRRATRELLLDGAELSSYFDRIFITEDRKFVNIEQAGLARSLLDYAQGKTGANIGVQPASLATTGITRSRTYLGTEAVSVLAAWQQLASPDDGLDFRVTAARLAGVGIQRLLVHGTPRIGRPIASSKLYLEVDVDSIGSDVAEDGTGVENAVYGIGSIPDGGSGDPPRAAYVSRNLLIARALSATARRNNSAPYSGTPRLERVRTFDGVLDATTLLRHVRGAVAARTRAPLTVSVDRFGFDLLSVLPGDEAQVRVQGDPFFDEVGPIDGRVLSVTSSVQPSGRELLSLQVGPRDDADT